MIWIQLSIGPLILILAIIFKAFPASKINGLYGHRTTRSMKSQEAWEASNKYAFDLMLWVAIITCIVQLVLYLTVSPTATILITSIVMCILLVGIIPLTEVYLKKNFDKDGRPKING